jgi:hypothetical protein
MLIISPKMASHVASTTPTALIARLQLLAYMTCSSMLSSALEFQVVPRFILEKKRHYNWNIQGIQLPEVLHKCATLPMQTGKRSQLQTSSKEGLIPKERNTDLPFWHRSSRQFFLE